MDDQQIKIASSIIDEFKIYPQWLLVKISETSQAELDRRNRDEPINEAALDEFQAYMQKHTDNLADLMGQYQGLFSTALEHLEDFKSLRNGGVITTVGHFESFKKGLVYHGSS